jgi:2-oxoisovalerate ferredoxin oxidoreductase beta subunit
MGIPITVVFVNNAIYGMTGGQLAPTSLIGQKTATSPFGRLPWMGQPLKVAELIAGLDGPVFVERVALYDNKQRVRAKKAIKKAVQLQVENRGFSFVEVLAECPTHLGLTPMEAESWVRDAMTPVFPLGVKKDLTTEPLEMPAFPTFNEDELVQAIEATTEKAPRFASGFPVHLDPADVALKLAGSGGDGAQTAALLIARAAINEGYDATHIPSYGPESRGGTSYADVHIAREEVLSPASPHPHILVAFNAPSLAKFGPEVAAGGTVIYDSSVIAELPQLPAGVRVIGVPLTGIAADLGRVVVKNVVALGALCAATSLFPEETLLTAIRQALRSKCTLIPLNEEAFAWGMSSVRGL